jgi:hypothetical protein
MGSEKPVALTDEFIDHCWPDMANEAGRAEIRRQLDALMAAHRSSAPPASEPIPEVADLVERLRDLGVRSADRAAALISAQAVMLEEAREVANEARLQLEYMDVRSPSGTTPAVIAKITEWLAKMEAKSHVG